MAEGLKAMALEGHGIAFLPYSAVKKELRAKRLVSAVPPDMKGLEITMDVRAYREIPSGKESQRGTAYKRSAQALWDYLVTQGSQPRKELKS
jgi:DNA-binding transcriptional LysR family regulator